jgi:hypothetical protein
MFYPGGGGLFGWFPIALTSRRPVRRGHGDAQGKEAGLAALSRAEFVAAVGERRRGSRQVSDGTVGGGLRFAFYRRMSTRELQDPETSRAWQRAVSEELFDGFGEVVVEFFDEGRSQR